MVNFLLSGAESTPAPMNFEGVESLWDKAFGWLGDVVGIVSGHPLLVVMLIGLPLVGLGVGLFKKLVR